MKRSKSLGDLIAIMATLRSPRGCPWDREQDHMSIRFHAVEEVYEMVDAIEAHDDHELEEELGDLLLQVVFHSQLASERGAFDFFDVCRRIVTKLIHRHPHVFGTKKLKNAEAVLVQWEQLKREEKHGTRHERSSALDGIPRHLPALFRAHELVKKARRAHLMGERPRNASKTQLSKSRLGQRLFALAEEAQRRGWNPEALLRSEVKKQEKTLRRNEARSRSRAERQPAK